jgi:hypothetical protein
MWKCRRCGEEVRDDFDTCWNCDAGIDDTLPENDLTPTELKTEGGRNVQIKVASEASSIMKRYQDAYLVARAVNGYGIFIKTVAIVAAILLALIGFIISAKESGTAIGFGLIIVGILVGVLFYLIGILISAQGQILKASLDSAVNSSPFLTDKHRAKIMSL